jgi:ring-1,2-phenylacetyl-CoA epoxidase subunit PaaE
MSVFHKVQVKSVQKETNDSVSITLDIPNELKNDFQYKSGQFLTFKVNVNGESLNRSYSLCSSPAFNEDPTVAVKVVKGGKVSTFFNEKLKSGDSLEVMPPMGNFLLKPSAENKKHYILFGGGSGITPLFSIIKTALKEEKESKVTLFYANFNSKSVIFKKQLTDLANANTDRFKVVHVFDEPEKSGGFLGFGKKSAEELDFVEGRIDEKKALLLLRENTDLNFKNAEFYMCGPAGLMDSVGRAMVTLAIPADRVHREFFTEKKESDKQSTEVGTQSGGTFDGLSKVSVIYDGNEYSFEMKDKETILDAALDANVDPPFACMVGACTTCRAKLIEGQVHMNDSEALTSKEIEEGYILTCQSHPKSNKLVVNYDK